MIAEAIQNRQVLRLQYDGISRLVVPHALGVSKKGNEILRCYPISGQHRERGHDWDLLTVAKIANLSTTGETFNGARSGYARGDDAMVTIYAQL